MLILICLAQPLFRKKLNRHKKGYWSTRENRAEFLTDFAKKMGFDPLVAENWRDKRWHLGAAGVLTSLNLANYPYRIYFNIGSSPLAPVWLPWFPSEKNLSKHDGWYNHKRYRNIPFLSLASYAHKSGLNSDTKSIRQFKAGHWEDLENRRQFLSCLCRTDELRSHDQGQLATTRIETCALCK